MHKQAAPRRAVCVSKHATHALSCLLGAAALRRRCVAAADGAVDMLACAVVRDALQQRAGRLPQPLDRRAMVCSCARSWSHALIHTHASSPSAAQQPLLYTYSLAFLLADDSSAKWSSHPAG